MEQLNLSLVRWGVGKLAAAQVMSLHPEQLPSSNGWLQQLPPQELEDLADQGEAALHMLIPAIADPGYGNMSRNSRGRHAMLFMETVPRSRLRLSGKRGKSTRPPTRGSGCCFGTSRGNA